MTYPIARIFRNHCFKRGLRIKIAEHSLAVGRPNPLGPPQAQLPVLMAKQLRQRETERSFDEWGKYWT